MRFFIIISQQTWISHAFKQIAHIVAHVCKRVTQECTITPCTRLADQNSVDSLLTLFHRLSHRMQNDPNLSDIRVYAINICGMECLWCLLRSQNVLFNVRMTEIWNYKAQCDTLEHSSRQNWHSCVVQSAVSVKKKQPSKTKQICLWERFPGLTAVVIKHFDQYGMTKEMFIML